VRAVIEVIKNTHRHPVNRALHCIGAPFYAIGAVMTLGHLMGLHTDLSAGAAMWITAIVLFVSGHEIEGNIKSMTPVLLFRLLSKTVHNSAAQRVHLLRA